MIYNEVYIEFKKKGGDFALTLGRVIWKFELTGGVDFGERRGVRVTLNPTVALTLGRDARQYV